MKNVRITISLPQDHVDFLINQRKKATAPNYPVTTAEIEMDIVEILKNHRESWENLSE